MVGPHLPMYTQTWNLVYTKACYGYAMPSFATEDLYLVLQNSGITRLSKLAGPMTVALGYLTVLLEYLNLSGHMIVPESVNSLHNIGPNLMQGNW